jgi:hypothetical protein
MTEITRSQFEQALERYRDRGQHLGGDATRIAQDFASFAISNGWSAESQVAASSVYEGIRQNGPSGVTEMPTPEQDNLTIERANELMRSNPDEYWRNTELRELALEALERQAAPQATSVGPAPTDTELERRAGQKDVARFEQMMRERPGEYWSSPQNQAAYRSAIERANLAEPEAPAPIAPAQTPVAPAPTAPAAEPAPAAPAPPPLPIAQGATT